MAVQQGNTEGELKSKFDLLQTIVYVMLLVLALGFGALLVAVVAIAHEAWTNKAATYQQLEDKVDVLLTRTQPSSSPSSYELPMLLFPEKSN